MLDTGILITECLKGEKYINSEIYKSILFDKLFINEGMFMENVVACSLINKDEKLYYYKHNDNINSENDIEIDLLIQRNGKICPIEVKSSVYKRHTSLDKFVTKYKKKIGRPYILYQKDILVRDGIYHLPIYMAGMI
jgi:predicted AAA+ superfamily ATPase